MVEDFVELSETFIFGGNAPTMQCFNISASDDGFVENEELFFILITSQRTLVDIPVPLTQVNIQNIDSEFQSSFESTLSSHVTVPFLFSGSVTVYY